MKLETFMESLKDTEKVPISAVKIYSDVRVFVTGMIHSKVRC